uniref:Reverse transcriptase domain-containing protein n=1 Tax=Tanacetum cinerariifolium TaxID=118510 RepID=A0A6L2LKG9_TANCI|nr:reverse transcriptase domain-containing protein [Tanacetum cinerariifolium]
MSTREHEKRYRSRRLRSLRPIPSVFSRIRRERSRSPRQRSKEGGVFKRLGNKEKSVSACSNTYNQHSHSRYMEALSESEDSEGNARVWFDDLLPESMDSYDDLKKAFLENHLQQKKAQDGRMYALEKTNRRNAKRKKVVAHDKGLKQNTGKEQPKTAKKREASVKDKARRSRNGGSDDHRGRNKRSLHPPHEKPPQANKPIVEERIQVSINLEYLEQTIMIGFTLIEEGRNKLCNLLQCNLDIFAWKPADMIDVPKHIIEHCLNVREGCSLVRQKKRGQAADRNQAIQEEVRKLIKACIMKEVHYHDWLSNPTTEAEEAFKKTKQLIAELPMLTAPMEKEELIVYLAATKETVSAVIMTEREAKQIPIYFVSRSLRGPELNYTLMKKLQVLSRPEVAGRLHKWSIELGEYAIHYRPRVLVKGQILADFIVERPKEDSSDTIMEVEEKLPEPWIFFTDGSFCTEGLGVGLILTNPEGVEFTYALRFRFDATNNEAEYEALIAGLRIAEQIEGPKKVKFLIVAIDYFTKWIEAKPVATITENQIKKFVWDNIVCRFGLPEEIISDNGKQFWDDPFKDWCEKLCIRHHFASVKHLQTNGLVERANRSLGEGIKARLDARSKNWMEELPHVLWAHRTMIKSSNEDTSFSLTYEMKAVIPTEIGMPTLRTAEVDLI